MNSQIAVVMMVRRNSSLRAVRTALEYAITISLAVLASYLILGRRW